MRYSLKDSVTGRTITVEADREPTQEDADEIFRSTTSTGTSSTIEESVQRQEKATSKVGPPSPSFQPSQFSSGSSAFTGMTGANPDTDFALSTLTAVPSALNAAMDSASEAIVTLLNMGMGSPDGPLKKGEPLFNLVDPLTEEEEKALSPQQAGVFNAVKDTLNSFVTPEMVATYPAFGLPGMGKKAAALFATHIGVNLPQQVSEASVATGGDAAYKWTTAALSAGMGGLLLKSATAKPKAAEGVVAVAEQISQVAPLTAEALKATAKTDAKIPETKAAETTTEAIPEISQPSLQAEAPRAAGEVADITKRPIGSFSADEISAMSNENISKLTNSKDESGGIRGVQRDSIVWGSNQPKDIAPLMDSLAKEAQNKSQEATGKDDAVANAEMAKATWFRGAAEGARKDGPTYKDLVRRGHITPESSQPSQTSPTKEKVTTEQGNLTPVSETLPAPSPEMAGMGAAVPSEFINKPQTATSIKNATVDAERAKRGLPPAIEPARRSFGTVWDEAMALIDHDPGYQDRLISELKEKPRALTDLEDAAILHRQIDLQNEYGKATRDLAREFEAGRTDMVELEKARVAALSDQLFDLYETGKKVGTETGRGLNARKMMAYEDFTLAKMEMEARASKGGRPLTEAERSEVVALNEKIERTQKAFDEYVEKTESQLAAKDFQEALDEMQKAPKTKPTPASVASAIDQTQKLKDSIKTKIEEGKRDELTPFVQRLARMFVEQGIRERDQLIDAVHGVLKEIEPNFTRRETMDAISGYGEFRQLTKDEISVKLRDLKGQMQQVAKLEDMQANRPPLKTGQERRVPSTEESRLIRLVNEAKNKFQVPITDPNTQLKSSLDMLKTRMKRQINEWEDRITRKDFSKKPKRIVQMDAEANRLHFENAQAKAKWHEALMKDRLENQSIPEKILRTGGEILNTSRAIITSADLSAVLRQGGFITLGHPIRAAQSFPAMIRAFRSVEGQHAVNREIMARKNYPLYQQGKLYLSEHGQSLSKMEEAYMSRWAEKIPFVAGSQRAYTTFLNKLRADSFDAMANSLANRGELTPAEVSAIANFVNIATGRGGGGIKQLDQAMVGMNTVFFAPRYVASRFQLALGTPLYRGTARTRIQIAKEYGRYLIGLGVVYGLGTLAGATIESDPRSADFGKLRFGKTRLDPLSGLAQVTTLLSRLFTGETKSSSGKIVPIRGEKIPFGGSDSADVMARFLRSKLSPSVGAIVNILTGKNIIGEPVTVGSIAKDLLVPLSFGDILDSMKEQGIPRGAALAILALFGMSVQNYEKR